MEKVVDIEVVGEGEEKDNHDVVVWSFKFQRLHLLRCHAPFTGREKVQP